VNTLSRFRCIPIVATAAWLLWACSHQKEALAPAAAPTVGQTSLQGTTQVPDTPTATTVAISEDILQACHIPDADAYFAFDSSHLTAPDHGALDAVAACFTSGPLTGRGLHLVGRADPRGTPEYNMTLGQSRADAVTAYLTARGVNPANASSTSRGAEDATGVDEAGWARDRRVDVLLAK
jgi:peptidoglycan-associated lipoprotein